MEGSLSLKLTLLLTLIFGSVSANFRSEADLDVILDNVNTVSVEGTPGTLSVYGTEAFTILAGESGGSNVLQPVIAGSRLGLGKVMGATHDDFFTDASDEMNSDGNRLILNSIKWVSPVPTPTVAILSNSADEGDSLVEFLVANNIPTNLLALQNITEANQLTGYDVVCTREMFDQSKVPVFRDFTENGGGLLIGVTSWAYYYFMNITGHFGSNFPPNMVTSHAGFVWHDDSGYAGPTNEDGTYDASRTRLQNTHVLDTWSDIRDFLVSGNFGDELAQNPLQFSTIFQNGLKFMPPNDTFITDEFYADAKNFTEAGRQPVATQENPVVEAVDKFKLELYFSLSSDVLKPEDVTAHPGSSYFPGQVASSKDVESQEPIQVQIKLQKPSWYHPDKVSQVKNSANQKPKNLKNTHFIPNSISRWHVPKTQNRRVKADEELQFNTKLPLWFSTGLYAPPGQAIQISVNSEEILRNFQIQIGTHTDDIAGKDEWYRSPKVVVKRLLENNDITLANPYGGLIYVVVPDEAITGEEQVFSAVVKGGVRAPKFKLGQTSVKEWRETIRYERGAWAEFETDNIIFSAPRASAELIDDPENLLIFWDEVMDAIADLAAIPRERYRQERIVPDILISAGFMHSGYPIMTFLEEGDLAINVTTLRREGSWGHWHELGHNHQQSAWTFDGTGEVTCNLFALYVYNTICGIPSEQTRPDMTPEVYRQSVSEFIDNGLQFEEWKSQPFLALLLYHQLQMEYGWTAFKQVFQLYHQLESEPSTEEEKIDLWLVMFSQVVQENLSGFFNSWNIPISADASESIAHLPMAGIQINDLLG